MIYCFFDGAVWPNPGGHAGYGLLVFDEDVILFSQAVYLGRSPQLSNNSAEYCGAIAAMRYLILMKINKPIPTSLHVCCGESPLGDVRLDKHAESVDVRADGARLPFSDNAFASILCDPPYNGEFQWNHDLLEELGRVACERIIFQHWFIPANSDGRYKKAQAKFALSQLFAWQPQTYFGRAQLISVFDKTETVQDSLFT